MNHHFYLSNSVRRAFFTRAMSSTMQVTEAQEITQAVHRASIKSVEDGDYVLSANRPCLDISHFMNSVKNDDLQLVAFRLDLTTAPASADLHLYDSSPNSPCPCNSGARIPTTLRLPSLEKGEEILLFRDVSLTHFMARTVAISRSEDGIPGYFSVVIDFTELVYPRVLPIQNLPATLTFLPTLLATITSHGLGFSSVQNLEVAEENREFMFLHISEGINNQLNDPAEWTLSADRSVPNQTRLYVSSNPNSSDLRR